jgi:hypothetical protein
MQVITPSKIAADADFLYNAPQLSVLSIGCKVWVHNVVDRALFKTYRLWLKTAAGWLFLDIHRNLDLDTAVTVLGY